MNIGSIACGYNRSLSRELQAHSKIRVVIIGEPLVANPLNPLGYPLSPISPSQFLPYALLPICNTPLIDYILENFVENGVSEVTILLNPNSVSKVQAHLSGARTFRGKPWTSSDVMKVNVLECMRDMHKLSDAINEIRQRNVVPQSGSFLIAPIDCISIFHNNLQDYFQKHLERARTIGKYAATLLCTSAKQNLNSTLYKVLVQGLEKQEIQSKEENASPTSMRGSVDIEIDHIMGCGRLRCRRMPSHPKGHHTMFVLDNNTGVVQYMSRLEANSEDAPEPPLITFSRKTQLSVRMDLIPTGLLFCCCEALALIDFHIRDIHNFLSTSLLGQAEIFGNVFGVLEVPTRHAIIEPVNSLNTYIEANLDVCARRLFPLTRDTLFAEVQAKYAVSSSSETVYMHNSAKALGAINGPNVVVGEDVVVPASVQLIGTVIGDHVIFGEGSSLTACVVFDGAQIGKCCNLKGSVIGYNAVIGDGIELVGCIIGHYCVLDESADGNETSVTNANTIPNGANASLSLQNQVVMSTKLASSSTQRQERRNVATPTLRTSCEILNTGSTKDNGDNKQRFDGKANHSLKGSDGIGLTIVDRYKDLIVDTSILFTEDAVPKVSSDVEELSIDVEDDEFELFRGSVRKNVNVALYKPSHIEAAAYDMSTICLSEGHSYPELCEIVTELLMEHVLHIHSDRGVTATLEGVRSLFAQWCRPFYNTFLSKNGQMNMDAMVATLEGLSEAIRDLNCVLHDYAPQLIEILYNGCDDELYYQRGYCIVSGQGLIAFDSAMVRRRQNLQRYAGFESKMTTSSTVNKQSHLLLVSDDSSDNSSDDFSDDFSRDSREEGKVLIAATCHNFILGVKNFLQIPPSASNRPAVHSENPTHKGLSRPDNGNHPRLVLISDTSEDEDESD
ncbi:unnamed protein product [Phytomonas sp. Hart1]|nr:unnamed protein product [Phytomonas sp. Hart1]|eukprot:CCW68606.1 unnamed protein product [Phytomonas sp. isolate Hart1]